MGLVRTPEAERDHRAIENSRLKTAEVLGIVDSHLASRPFLAGRRLTIGDIPLGCSIWRWMALPIERPSLPNVRRWFGAGAAPRVQEGRDASSLTRRFPGKSASRAPDVGIAPRPLLTRSTESSDGKEADWRRSATA